MLEAHYQDGYIHSELGLGDVSPYDPKRNIFYDIYNRLPEEEHGPLVKLVLHHNGTHELDWQSLPESARPIRFKHMERRFGPGIEESARIVSIDFGYQYTQDGKNYQEVRRI